MHLISFQSFFPFFWIFHFDCDRFFSLHLPFGCIIWSEELQANGFFGTFTWLHLFDCYIFEIFCISWLHSDWRNGSFQNFVLSLQTKMVCISAFVLELITIANRFIFRFVRLLRFPSLRFAARFSWAFKRARINFNDINCGFMLPIEFYVWLLNLVILHQFSDDAKIWSYWNSLYFSQPPPPPPDYCASNERTILTIQFFPSE